MSLEDKMNNAKPSDLFDDIPKNKQRLIIQKNKRRLKRLKRRIRMKLIIDIPEETYNLLKTSGVDWLGAEHILDAVSKGIPLPKGHGDLIDRSKLLVELECGIRAGNYEEGYEKYPHINDMDDCFDTVKYADIIIEADKENKQ